MSPQTPAVSPKHHNYVRGQRSQPQETSPKQSNTRFVFIFGPVYYGFNFIHFIISLYRFIYLFILFNYVVTFSFICLINASLLSLYIFKLFFFSTLCIFVSVALNYYWCFCLFAFYFPFNNFNFVHENLLYK